MQDRRKEKFVKDFVKRFLKEKCKVVEAESAPTAARDGFVRTPVSWMDRLKKSSKLQ